MRALFLILLMVFPCSAMIPCRQIRVRAAYVCPIPTIIFYHRDHVFGFDEPSQKYARQALRVATNYYEKIALIKFNVVSEEYYEGILWNDQMRLIKNLNGFPDDIMLRIIFTNDSKLYKADFKPEDEKEYFGHCFPNVNLMIISQSDELYEMKGKGHIRGLDSVLRHEFGHVIGLSDKMNPKSFMAGEYSGEETHFTPYELKIIQDFRANRCP